MIEPFAGSPSGQRLFWARLFSWISASFAVTEEDAARHGG